MRVHPLLSYFIIILTCTFVTGCSESKIEFETDTVTEAEANQFAKKMESAVSNSKKAEYLELMNVEILIDKTVDGLKMPAKHKKQIVKELQAGLFGQITAASNGPGGSYELLRVRKKNDGYRAIFRLKLGNEGGINYHEVQIVKLKKGGKIQAADIYVYLTGEYLSQTMRRVMIPVAAQANRSILEKLSGKESEFIKNSDKIKRYAKLAKSKNGTSALAIYNQLPKSLKEDKNMLVLRIMASQNTLDVEKDYMAAMNDFRRLFPNDPALLLMSIDYYAVKGDAKKLEETFNNLDTAVGGDPYLKELQKELKEVMLP